MFYLTFDATDPLSLGRVVRALHRRHLGLQPKLRILDFQASQLVDSLPAGTALVGTQSLQFGRRRASKQLLRASPSGGRQKTSS